MHLFTVVIGSVVLAGVFVVVCQVMLPEKLQEKLRRKKEQ